MMLMKWFGRKAAGRGWARPPLAKGWLWAATGDLPPSYETQVREAYLTNPVAQRAVRLVCEGVAATPLRISGAGSSRLRRLIGARSAGQAMIETVALHLLLHGNAYIQVLTDGAGQLAEFYALRPDRVTLEADGRGWPVAFLYRVGDTVSRIAAEDPAGRPGLIHLRTAHPLDDHYGLGCLGAAGGAVAIHNAANRWNRALLDNAARPSGAMVYDPGEPGATLTAEQFDRLKSELAAGFSGPNNAGRPMLLEGGLKWQSMSLTPADMDFVSLKSAAAREIALAFGVPPMLLGLPGDNSYANYREANRALWRQTILPLATMILSGLAEGVSAWFPDHDLQVDRDQIGALADERERLWTQVSEARFLTDAQKRALLGLERLEMPEPPAAEPQGETQPFKHGAIPVDMEIET